MSGSVFGGVVRDGKQVPSVRVASLCNLGNTCFLNSVLYTLRFTPGFSHSIHHLATDLLGPRAYQGHSSSSSSSSSNTNSSSSKGGNPEVEVIERLHELFRSLKSADELESREPVQPSSFLQSVSRLNPIFEGNRQQDAHELLMMILDMLQEIRVPPSPPEPPKTNGHIKAEEPKKGGGGYRRWKSSSPPSNLSSPPPSSRSNTPPSSPAEGVVEEESSVPNFIKENFVGKAVMSTRCMECEMSTYRSEPFTNIDIALSFEDEEDQVHSGGKEQLFLKKIMASETLKENNKYWCEECSRLNEATRSVSYELLPNIMVLQLMRFTATGCKTYMSKINDYIPTPFSLDCFCTQCSGKEEPGRHRYRLYAVIMHLGGTLASGHYISYVRASLQSPEYSQCQRGATGSASQQHSIIHHKNNKNSSSKKPWIVKYLSSKMNGKSSNSNSSGGIPYSEQTNGYAATNGVGSHSTPFKSHIGGSGGKPGGTCRSYLCCGLKGGLHLEAGGGPRGGGDLGSSNESLGSNSTTTTHGGDFGDDYWLECDDENINAISRKQFEDILSAKQGATTPYLLFYQKY